MTATKLQITGHLATERNMPERVTQTPFELSSAVWGVLQDHVVRGFELCEAVGNAYWNHRMLAATAQPRYADLLAPTGQGLGLVLASRSLVPFGSHQTQLAPIGHGVTSCALMALRSAASARCSTTSKVATLTPSSRAASSRERSSTTRMRIAKA